MTLDDETPTAAADSLSAPLNRLDRILARAVERTVDAYGPQSPDPFRGLYISDRDAAQWSRGPRWAPAIGAALEEPPLVDAIGEEGPLAGVAHRYGLSSFDLEALVIALGPDVDLRYGSLYAFLQDDVSRRWAGIDLVLTLLCPTPESKLVHLEHFAVDAPLMRSELIDLVPEHGDARAPLPAHQIKVDEALVRQLLGLTGLHERLARTCTLLAPEAAPFPPEQELLELVSAAARAAEPLRFYLSGPATQLKRQTAHAVAGALKVPLLAADPSGATPDDAETFLPTLFREAEMLGAIVYLDPVGGAPDARDAVVQRLSAVLQRRGPVVFLAGTEPDPPRGPGFEGLVQLRFPMPDHEQRLLCWEAELRARGVELADADVDALAGRYRLTVDQIADAVAVARNYARMAGRAPEAADLLEAARTRASAETSTLARRIEPSGEAGPLVLPEDTAAQLEEMLQQILAGHRVLDEWGFGRRHVRGRGVSALFAGPSGTGKTTAAENLARRLGLDLLKIDLSAVVSKYIGETEKNLRRIFASAESSNAIVFFDEADALFGKRSEVRDSHDRYANIEIAYLLDLMERYEGVAILATNLRQNMDDAFVRRLRFIVPFPVPMEADRETIWKLQFPPEADREPDIDFATLARQFRITGGSIRNIVLGAAFLAAGDDRAIGSADILRATRREYQKLGRRLDAAELGPLNALVAA